MNKRHLKGSDIAHPPFIHGRTVHQHTTKRIRSIQHDDLHPILKACLHRVSHTADISVTTNPDVLEIDYQGIDLPQHRRRRFSIFPVQGKNGKARTSVNLVVYRHGRFFVAVDAMLRTEQGNQIHVRLPPQHFNRALPNGILSRRMRE